MSYFSCYTKALIISVENKLQIGLVSKQHKFTKLSLFFCCLLFLTRALRARVTSPRPILFTRRGDGNSLLVTRGSQSAANTFTSSLTRLSKSATRTSSLKPSCMMVEKGTLTQIIIRGDCILSSAYTILGLLHLPLVSAECDGITESLSFVDPAPLSGEAHIVRVH